MFEIISESDSTNPRENKITYNALLTLGDIQYQTKDDLQAATPFFLKAIKMAESFQSPFDYANLNRYMGYLYYRQSNHKEARDAFLNSFLALTKDSFLTFDRAYFLQEQLDNIALTYLNESEYDKAIFYFDSTLSFIDIHLQNIKEQPRNDAISIAKGNKARALLYKGEAEKGQKLLRENFSYLMSSKRYYSNAVVNYFGLTQSKVRNNSPMASSMLDTLQTLLKEHPVPPLREKIKKLEAEFYAKKDPEKAVVLLENYIEFKDSLYKAMSENNFRKQVVNQKAELAEDKAKLIEKEKEVNSQLANMYLVLFFISVLALLGLFVLLSNLTKKNQNLKKLNKRILHQKETIDKTAEKLRASNERLQELSDQKTGILSVVAHDLKSPIDAIISTTEFLRDEKISEQEQAEFLELIRLSSENAESIIQELAIFSELEDGNFNRMKLETCKPEKFTQQAIKLNKIKAEEKAIEIVYEPDPIAMVNLDVQRATRIMNNLLSNAIKFSNRNSKVAIKEMVKNGKVEISVVDYGIGIPKSKWDEIFKPFNSFRRSGTNNERSTGLGLSIVKNLVEIQDGTISLKSKEGKGSTFTLSFPQV